jgi:hypothetical protein
LAATSAKLANYVGDRGGKLAWRQYAPNWKITMALDIDTVENGFISNLSSHHIYHSEFVAVPPF